MAVHEFMPIAAKQLHNEMSKVLRDLDKRFSELYRKPTQDRTSEDNEQYKLVVRARSLLKDRIQGLEKQFLPINQILVSLGLKRL